MKKVTIKHYLNKRLQPSIIYDGITAYPLYLQIIVQRKSQQIKSFFNAYQSEEAFNIMTSGGSKAEYINFSIGEEPKAIQTAIEYLIQNNIVYSLKSDCFKEFINTYLEPAYKVFSREAAKVEIYDNWAELFINCLNLCDNTLLMNQRIIKQVANINILDYLPADYIKIWQVVEIIKQTAGGCGLFPKFASDSPKDDILKAMETEAAREICKINPQTYINKGEVLEIFGYLSRRINQSIKILFA